MRAISLLHPKKSPLSSPAGEASRLLGIFTPLCGVYRTGEHCHCSNKDCRIGMRHHDEGGSETSLGLFKEHTSYIRTDAA